MLLTMVAIGWWVSARIEQNVVDSTATATALYMDSFIAPLVQELETADKLSIGPVRAIEEMISGSELGKRIVAVKIWKPGGLVAYSDESSIVGRRFPVSSSLQSALAGQVVAEFNHLDDAENEFERNSETPLLEIYSPIRQSFTGRILGVVEFYENATALERTLVRTQLQSWGVVALVTLAVGCALFGIVHRGSRLIERQKGELQTRLREIEVISLQNGQLRRRVQRASQEVSEANERTLSRISAELHDGPKQLIGFALMRLDTIARDVGKQAGNDITVVSGALRDALQEIGNLSNDLALPELEGLSLDEILRNVVAAHTFRTGTEVDLALSTDPVVPLSKAILLCAYRFVQETLNNAWRYASGMAQTVTCAQEGGTLRITVTNGPGPSMDGALPDRIGGLGLSGLRRRIESLGGTFGFQRTEAGGAIARMQMETDSVEDADA